MIDPVPETLRLGAAPGPELHLLTLGATVHRLIVTGGDGIRRDVVLGLPGPAELLASTDYLGATIGRYANRIAGGRFELDGRQIEVTRNDRGNCLHGGDDGFDRRVWEVAEHGADRARLRLVSPDGDQGFPGELRVEALFEVLADGVELELTARTTRPTVVNLTSHAYLNLEGDGSVDRQVLRVPASRYTPVDATGIPLGGHEPVDGTPFDLRAGVRVGEVARSGQDQVAAAHGIDHNLVVDGQGWRPVARLESEQTRTAMELWSDQPCLQVYTGNFLDGSTRGREGTLLRQGDGIALEPQLAPDSPNHPDWPSPVLLPGATYRCRIGWHFSALG